MIPRAFILAIIVCSAVQSATPQDPVAFWQTRKIVTQIPWTPTVSRPSLRSDFRQEFAIDAIIRPEGLKKLGETHDLILYARVVEGNQTVGSIHSTLPEELPEQAPAVQPQIPQPVRFSMLGLARPGRYRLELALLDRVSGKYSTRFEEIVVEGNPQDPVERSFEPFARVEIVPEATEDPWSRPENQLLPAKSPLNIQLAIGGINVSGNPRLIGRRAMLTSRDRAFTPDRPSFVIDTPRTTHLSVITILNPPEAALNDGLVLDLFQKNLSHLLGVITRLDVPRGTARLIGLDLPERTRVFDQVDMKGIAADTLRNAITKDQSTVTLESLTRPDTRGEFFRDVLKERFEEAEKDTSGARHAIIVVSASSKFPNNSNLALSPARNCPCEVFYISFALVQHDRDDIDHMLRAYKPQVFQPATWREFREDFGRIYERLLR